MDKEFENFYKQALLPEVNRCREIRLKAENKVKKQRKRNLIIGGISAILLLPVCVIYETYVLLLLPAPFLLSGIKEIDDTDKLELLTEEEQKKVTKIYKRSIIFPIFRYYFPDVEYIPSSSLSAKTMKRSLLFSDLSILPKRLIGEDYIRLTIGATRLQFNEVDPKFFNGIFGVATFNKKFNSRTLVFSKWARDEGKRWAFSNLNNGKKIEMDSLEFSEKFKVYGEDPLEVHYILTPNFMKRLIEFNEKMSQGISFSFIDNLMFFKIPIIENLFDLDMRNDSNEYFQIMRHREYFLYITGIVEALNLNTRIWTKE